jgi:protein TonB
MGYQALLFCPDEKTARAVTQVLTELDFTVEPCSEPFAAVKKLMAQHFDAVVVDCDNEQNATLLFKSARNSASNQSSLAVAVVEGQAGVAKAFRIGANLVLTKPINIEQAKGTLRVARGLLRKGGDPSKSASPSAAAPAAQSPAPSTTNTRPAGTAFQPQRPAPVALKPSVAPPVRTPATAAPAPVATASIANPEKLAASPRQENIIPKVPAAKPAAPTSPAGAPKKNYPWQPTKPGAEPMASALRKAAEAAGIAENAEPPIAEISSPVANKPLITPTGMAAGAASAPAPAKVKPAIEVPLVTPAASPVPAPEPVPAQEAPIDHGEKEIAQPEPPSFSMGAPAYEEEEPTNSKKALIIVAAVVLLAALAGYLGWKNMSGKSTPAPTGSVSTPTTSPASSAAPVPNQPLESASPVDAPSAASRSSEALPSVTTKPSPAAKAPAHDVAAAKNEDANAEEPAPQPAAPAFVVKNEQSRPAAKSNSQEIEQPVAPSAIGVATGADTKALAAISSAPVSVPRPSTDVVKISQGVSEGLVLKRVPPRYPPQALQLHKEGAVQLQATVTKTGEISNIKVLSGDPMLARAAEDAVRQWKYKPYYLNGEPVDIQTQITVNFKLPR